MVQGLEGGAANEEFNFFHGRTFRGDLSALTSNRHLKRDGDMTAFNKLVSTMKARGTLATQPKVR